MLDAAATERQVLERRRQEHEALVIEGRGARAELDSANRLVVEEQAELDALQIAADQLAKLQRLAAGIDRAERELEVLTGAATAATAAAAAARAVVSDEPPPVDEAAVVAGPRRGGGGRASPGGVAGLGPSRRRDSLERARAAADRSATLSGAADCPVCGQSLGDAFEQVQAHRAGRAGRRPGPGDGPHGPGQNGPGPRQGRRRPRGPDGSHCGLRPAGPSGLGDRSTGADRRPPRPRRPPGPHWSEVAPERTGPAPAAAALAKEVVDLRRRVEQQRAAAAEAERLRGRLERRPVLAASLEVHREIATVAADRVQTLRDKVRALGYDPAALGPGRRIPRAGARGEPDRDRAGPPGRHRRRRGAHQAGRGGQTPRRGRGAARQAGRSRVRGPAPGPGGRPAGRVPQHRGRFGGPRLAVQAAELFGELTDHEYDELQVDPETYQLQISDGGKVYGLDRFSGSEIDLANLALRVAISEHIHFQSGGSIGLMVLDEVFGPLDEERKARMLLALERLRGRFRQVLVVTHDAGHQGAAPQRHRGGEAPRTTSQGGAGNRVIRQPG